MVGGEAGRSSYRTTTRIGSLCCAYQPSVTVTQASTGLLKRRRSLLGPTLRCTASCISTSKQETGDSVVGADWTKETERGDGERVCAKEVGGGR